MVKLRGDICSVQMLVVENLGLAPSFVHHRPLLEYLQSSV